MKVEERFVACPLGEDWLLDAEGYPHRKAARVLVINTQGKLLLIKGHDFSDPNHSWWFTIGGGIKSSETSKQAACRELKEETGIAAVPKDLIGPVLRRQVVLHFSALDARQDEEYFLYFLAQSCTQLKKQGWTGRERSLLDEIAWFGHQQLKDLAQRETVYPLGLAQMLANWENGWDGKLLEVTED